MRTTAELREGFLSYFESKQHQRHPSGSLIPPPDDATTLFTIAGMQPLRNYFTGASVPPAPRLVTVQKVMRAGGKHNDLDDVGRAPRYCSFFEMLGNFSLGDYFKDGAIDFAWEFVMEHLRFPEEKVWATVFAGDPELGLELDEAAVAGWLRVGIPRERIVALPRSENFWQAADTGPCGPNTEIFLDRGEKYGCGRPTCAPGCECDRYLEFWNLVFMEFELAEDGTLSELPKQNVDTGMGLERTASLLQTVDSNFDIDNVRGLIAWAEEHSGTPYGGDAETIRVHRVIADHARAATFLIADGVLPSNEGRGYVLRRVIRRAVQYGRRIGLRETFLPELSDIVREQMARWYPELEENRAMIHEYLRGEEERFSETLERGMKLFDDVAARGSISGEDAFKLHDTYGFPWELTRELALERGLAIDEETFTRLMAEQRERSRQTSAFDASARFAGAPKTEFVGYERIEVLTAIVGYHDLGDGTFQAKLERSPFYPEGGGQVSDTGYIEHVETGARAELVRAIRLGDDQELLFHGSGFVEGDRVRAVVPWSIRFPTMANHTATHLLHKALQEVLGDHVRQAGSAVRPEKLRFDFTHPQALDVEQDVEIERRVNEKIFANLPVRAFETPIEEARTLGAMMLFGEKYGDVVRVVEIGDGWSRELCGGTHVRSTAEIGAFTILSESSVGAGVRRIEALTSGDAYALLHERAREADELRAEVERLKRESKKKPSPGGPDVIDERRSRAGDVEVIVVEATDATADELLALSDRLMQQHPPAAVVLGARDNGRVHLVVNLDRSLEARGLDAVKVVRRAAALVGGGGGGRPTMARAGGKDPEKLPEALAEAERALVEALS
jgi:alanyl-tRNA synthetase